MNENIRSINRSALTQQQNSVVSVSIELLQRIGMETTCRSLCMQQNVHAQKCICHKNADEKRKKKKKKKKERLEKEKTGKRKKRSCDRVGIANHHSALVPYAPLFMVVYTNLSEFYIPVDSLKKKSIFIVR